ncbi:hypothetical protein [Solirubrobacter soli]|uniref:hypothetical protein n=1 Tax=Solirubrobacter soli TaxID=363832 RepID=UPI0003FE9B74|nr:hypothetical protein [Solirubrobacter soli]
MADGTLHIDLDLHVTGGDVEGRAATDGQPERPFSGWVELLAALDAIIASGAAPGEAGARVAAPSGGEQ